MKSIFHEGSFTKHVKSYYVNKSPTHDSHSFCLVTEKALKGREKRKKTKKRIKKNNLNRNKATQKNTI